MKNKIFSALSIVILLPLSANATALQQFNTECTFNENIIKGKNTTGGEIIKAAEDAVHTFSIDLIAKNYCDLSYCGDPTEFISQKDDEIVTSTSGSGGVPDEDGDVYELKESFNPKTDIFTLNFTYYDEKGDKIVGSSRIDYQCNIDPFDRSE